MNIIHVYGGLGNQMFQYAFYKNLLQKYPNNTFLSLEYFNNKRPKAAHGTKFLLSTIFENIEFETHEDTISKILYKDALIWRILRAGRKFIFNKTKVFDTYSLVNEKNYTLIDYSKKNHFRSYWQNSNFPNENEELLRKEFVFKTEELGVQNRECLENIQKVNSVSLHVRRGDYLKLSDRYGNICTLDYYLKSIETIKEHVPDPFFYIFSDDIAWCKNTFKNLESRILVDWNKGNSHYDMLLMSKCKHNITANSSFSWWAGWLNNNPDKIVIMPNKWTIDLSCSNYIYPNCITI